jgi:diacylglycerol O-acyltransferase / wax synthase
MSRSSYTRLSAQDHSFLVAERRSTPMHVGAIQIYEAGPLRRRDGGIDVATFKRGIESVMHLLPRYRQRLRWTPLEGSPVWVDDRQFNLDYHVRHTALPRPGGSEELKRLAARIMGQELDRSRPLWEMWVVEGLEGDRFGVIAKIHHCMMDGMSGVDVAHILLSPSAEYELHEPMPYVPRTSPTGRELLRDALLRRATIPVDMGRALVDFAGSPTLTSDLRERFDAVRQLVSWAVHPASQSPLNGRLCPHRRFEWLSMPLADVKGTAKALRCSVNDVVLATVAGAVREFCIARRAHPDEIDFRVSAPVSVRRDEDRNRLGNAVSSWILRLPIDEPDPKRRLEAIHRVTDDLKRSRQALGVQMMMAAAEWAPQALLSLGARAASGPINMIVTNVPGPQFPLYQLGARLLELYPLVPLLENTGLGVALFSYDGRLCWGFNADYDLLPDLRIFVRATDASFRELREAAGVKPSEQPGAGGSVIPLRTGHPA